MDDRAELEKAFGKAATKARAMATRKVLTDAEHTELLGLFQQATVGDGNVWKMFKDKKFLVSGTTGCAKNVNWLALHGMTQSEAKEKYVELVEDLMKKYCVVFPPSRFGSMSSISSARFGSMASISSACTTYTYVPPTSKDQIE